MTLAKAYIEVKDADAIDASRGLPGMFEVQFNPTELTLAKGATFAEVMIPGIDSPILQFVAGQNEKMTLDLFFDTTSGGMGAGAKDVQSITNSFYQLVKIQPKTHAPPRIRFKWGSSIDFVAVVESVQRKYTLFSPEGIPLRATLTTTLREYKSLDDQLRALNLQSSDHTKRCVVCEGDTLGRIAYREYGDPSAWRHLAAHNLDRLTSLRRLTPGVTLELPPLDPAMLQSGEGP